MSKNIEKQYLKLLKDILDTGVEKQTRNGETISVFGRQIRHDMSKGFPLLTTKKMYWKGIVTELIWFLRGDTNIKFLVDNDCHIWDGDAYKNYCKIAGSIEEPDYDIHIDDPNQNCTRLMTKDEFINRIKTDDKFAKKWGDLGPVYGKQWRSWVNDNYYQYLNSFDRKTNKPQIQHKITRIDQIANLINDLKTNPDSRRLMVNAWNVGELDQMVLPPCHYGFQVYTRELSDEERAKLMDELYGIKKPEDRILPWLRKDIDEAKIPTRAISLMFNMRSNDVPLGLPFNIASYGLLLEIIGNMINMIPDELIANLGDAHIYIDQIDGVKEQLTRTPMKLPNLIISDDVNFNGTIDDFLDSCSRDSFKLDGYESHPSIKMPLSN